MDAGPALRRIEAVTDTALARLSLDELLPELVARVRRILEVDTAALLLVDGDVLRPRAASGLEESLASDVRIPFGEGFAGRIAAEARAIVIEDVRAADVVNPILRDRGVRSLLGVPILFEACVLGVLHVGTLALRRFLTADAQLLQLVADRIGVGIAYARLYEEEREARLRAEAG